MSLPQSYYVEAIKDHLKQAIILLEECPSLPLTTKILDQHSLEDILCHLDQKEVS